MSRFKFRIWDKTKDEWLGASDKNSVTFRNFDLCGQTLRMQQLPLDIEDGDKYIIEQWTGFEDKKGNSIYYGDIVHYDTGFISVFGVDNLDFVAKVGKDLNNSPRIELDDLHSYDVGPNRCMLKVVGNIHENPELLPKTLKGLYD